MNGTSLGVLSVAVPAPARHVHHARRPDADSAPILASSLFQSIPLSIGVRTEEMPMPAAAVGAWAPGSVIELKHRVDTPLVAMVGNARLWSMTLGSNEGSLTAKILGRAPGPDSRPLLPGIPKTLPNPSASKGPSMSEISVEEAVQAASGALDGAGAPVAGAGESAPGAANPIALGPLGDVPVEVAVEIGRASVTLREAVTLGVGQVLTLDSEAGSPAAVLVNGQVVARGQVVIVDDFYGVRISELTNQ